MKQLVTIAIALSLVAIAYGAAGLMGGEPAAEACPVYEPPPSFDVSGTYDSTAGPVALTQSRYRITGTYECCGGGTIAGYLRDKWIHFSWKQPGAQGKGVWNVDGAKMTGTWGWGNSATDGGEWNLVMQVRVAKAD